MPGYLRFRTIPASALLISLFACSTASSALAATHSPFLTLIASSARYFARSVASGRDVNGDGYEDVLVGAAVSGPGAGGNTGEVLLYFGGPGADSIPDLTIKSEPDYFAGPFGGLGTALVDVNGDGYADIAVGNIYGDSKGQVFVYFGGPEMDAIPDLVLSGTFTGELFGFAISSAGDLNGDGYEDLVVTSPNYIPLFDPEADVQGRAYIYFGGPTVDADPDLILETPYPKVRQDFSHFGNSVAPAGDLNGDGMADLIVGHMEVPNASPCCFARAFVYYGGNLLDAAPDRSLRSSPFTNGLIHSVSPAGDFNGDGYDDVAVTGYVTDSTGIISTRAYLYFGGPVATPDPVPSLILVGDPSGNQFGRTILGGRDLNGDGHPDLLIGDPGRAFVFYGGVGADSIPDDVLDGRFERSDFGARMAIGDVNGDGVADAIVAATDNFGANGHVYVYDLSSPLESRAFPHARNSTIALNPESPPLCLRFEPVSGSYSNAQVDPASLRLVSPGTGDVSEIAATPFKSPDEGDTDRNGITELGACFTKADLAPLFSTIRGRRTVEVALEGHLVRGRRFRAPLSLAVVGGGSGKEPSLSLRPNPFNPTGTLSFETANPGQVSVRLFDVTGRCVRRVWTSTFTDAGIHDVRFDGRDDRGSSLASGVYFYRIEGPDGILGGRIVIAK